MCLLMISMPGDKPTREHLENACINNPDGFGYAVHHGDHIVSGRGMNPSLTIDRFLAELDNSKNAIGMFHSRYTTHGKTNTENAHPFRVGGRKDILLGHNGILPVSLAKNDHRSDTRVFAEDILPSMGVDSLDDKTAFARLESWSKGSKVAILSTAKELRDDVYILNESDGHWKGGLWWSNSSYEYRYSYSYGSSSSSYYDGGYGLLESDKKMLLSSDELIGYEDKNGMFDVCYHCYNQLGDSDYEDGACGACNTCIDCNEHLNQCLCYTPTNIRKGIHAQSVQPNWWNEETIDY